MKLMVVERSSGVVLGSGNNQVKLFELALGKGAVIDDLVFVNGELDIHLFKFAGRLVKDIGWLPASRRKHNVIDALVFQAEAQLELWQSIRNSRLVESPDWYAKPLDLCIGPQLAADVMFVLNIEDRRDSRICAPDTRNEFNKARDVAYRISLRCARNTDIVVATHEHLGVIVVAPESLFPASTKFSIKCRYRGAA